MGLETIMERKRKSRMSKPTEYVVGRKQDGFCWLLAVELGENTDDQDIGLALRFRSLEEAARAAEEHLATVFLIVDETTWPATLEEVP
ncbi:MAG: hypothetical protein QOI49_2627 [Verrucomicrobiota bacterium]|jgi:hypothetical protein